MPSILTLDGARAAPVRIFRGLADAWSDDNAPPGSSALGEATWSLLGWGVVAFATTTVAVRGWRGLKKAGGFAGARSRRRRRRR